MKSRVACCLLMVLALCAPAFAANPSFGDALRSAKAGDARSQYIVGMMYLFGQGTRPDGQELLARAYLLGRGTSKDYAAALELFAEGGCGRYGGRGAWAGLHV